MAAKRTPAVRHPVPGPSNPRPEGVQQPSTGQRRDGVGTPRGRAADGPWTGGWTGTPKAPVPCPVECGRGPRAAGFRTENIRSDRARAR